MLEVHRQSGGFTPWNVYPACPRMPCEMPLRCYFTGVGQDDRTGVESEGYSSGVGQNDRTGALCAMHGTGGLLSATCPPRASQGQAVRELRRGRRASSLGCLGIKGSYPISPKLSNSFGTNASLSTNYSCSSLITDRFYWVKIEKWDDFLNR